MTGTIMPYCIAMGCPIKLKCSRYKEGIDFRSEAHLASTPYDHIEGKCSFFVGNVTETFLDHLKELKDEKGGKN